MLRMKVLYLFFGLVLIHLLSMNSSFAQSLEDYRWKKRLVFIMNPGGDNPLMHPQVKSFREFSDEISERETLLFIKTGDRVTDPEGNIQLVKIGEIPYNNFQGVVLIGKDGGVKLKEEFPVEPSALFSLIDSMPMRKAEMRSSKKH